ncbi:MAG: NADH-quinone oxidoreductase subunit NuoI [Thermodesulfatator sp.]|nr:MAG: NADH-quinone oxidoreductase subunit NuoI [Thermodesulfatator sp.]
MSLTRTVFLTEIVKGLALTLRKMFSRPVTVQYPEEKKPLAPGFRGRHALVRDPHTGRERCIGCLRCAKVCPSRCIYIETERDPETRRMVVKRYEIEVLRCVFCGYCEEVCPVNALVLTEFYEYAGESREEVYFDKEKLLQNWDEFIMSQRRPYLNPYWKPRGIPETRLPVFKRKAEGV